MGQLRIFVEWDMPRRASIWGEETERERERDRERERERERQREMKLCQVVARCLGRVLAHVRGVSGLLVRRFLVRVLGCA
jgi:hypothetical protein